MIAFEEARRRLIGAASMYGAGKNMAAKCPELAATPHIPDSPKRLRGQSEESGRRLFRQPDAKPTDTHLTEGLAMTSAYSSIFPSHTLTNFKWKEVYEHAHR